jgi:leucyl aminopeptidase (aminopeptidase T)
MQDSALSGERRWMILQCGGLDQWEVAATEFEIIQKRTRWLFRLLKNAKTGRITSPGGTDLVFGLGDEAGLTNILGIIPFYGEVAVTPALSNTSGVFVIDRCTQGGVRPADELDREPLRITVQRGRAVDLSGDPVQLGRLKQLIKSGNPPADAIDEVGIVTTHLRENNLYYWSDGTHRYDCVHIALGNNVMRDVVVHGSVHMDGEVSKPTIAIDGLVVIKGGTFQDQAMGGME